MLVVCLCCVCVPVALARGAARLGPVLLMPARCFRLLPPPPHTHQTHLNKTLKKPNQKPPKDPSNRRKIVLDDKLATIFTHPVDMFSMNKQLSRHVKSAGNRVVL